ncbi:MAG: hypothetical protein C4305_05210, partial [Thermoleophilia bacterium]
MTSKAAPTAGVRFPCAAEAQPGDQLPRASVAAVPDFPRPGEHLVLALDRALRRSGGVPISALAHD